jgi:hypothetical protein
MTSLFPFQRLLIASLLGGVILCGSALGAGEGKTGVELSEGVRAGDDSSGDSAKESSNELSERLELVLKGAREIEVQDESWIQLDVERVTSHRIAPDRSTHCSPSLLLSSSPLGVDRPFKGAALSALALSSAALITLTDVPLDKQKHYLAGVLVGGGASGLAKLLIRRDARHYPLKALLVGVGSSFVVGIAKEVRDQKSGKGTPEVMDAVATGLGGIHGSIAIDLVDLKRLFKP